ncbi:THUMP domain-containing class I SAM-dependent RNA methyltransferase [Bombilactobacillus thymidiniphilus]|uniref:Class I SAM-dependent RNA methyltransferase n=1 Tax=Bombilactobacillus thymidiniphilus TaxID=2923363 RepID=A0ABY4PDJ7_9LACO|nr:class I SAM-dependent RNA methyltransferase [Bombilactobacillus thymidiniphilus]UQS83571.1 class I SAM-dependent RNA methyltransferase [Bombilactobacillus thymidiniphilus]
MKLLATMASGFEAVTKQELHDLNYQSLNVENGKVYFEGDFNDVVKTNLWLRSADRIKIVLAEFSAVTFEELFEQVKAIAWDQWLPLDASFPVKGRSVRSQLHSEPDVQAITKKAIVDKMASIYHRRGRLPETGNLFQLEVRIVKDQVEITLDTTGDSLFKRGYRVEHGGAPLKENFAAALVLLTPWRATDPFHDPTTGSGTIAIEAALIGRHIAPGLQRHFAFENFDWFDPTSLSIAQEEARAKILPAGQMNITACDIDGTMIDVAKINANNAGVLHDIIFKQLAVKDNHLSDQNGILVANPPYGKRMQDAQKVHQLYRQMGQSFGKLTTWSKYYLSSDLDFAKYYGQKPTKRRKLYNGALQTDLFQYWGHPTYKK